MEKYAIIVTYEPELLNLKRLTEETEKAGFIPIVADNSQTRFVEKSDLSSNSQLIRLGSNQGIAKAQNAGIIYALEQNAKFLVFFDQDSNADAELISKLADFVKKNESCVAVPLALDKETLKEYPVQIINRIGYPSDVFVKGENKPQRVDLVISSGMMMSADVIRKVGLYDEDFFIDFVDIEWCIRCKKSNIPIYVLPDAVLLHKIGSKNIEVSGREITVHGAARTYYKVRNSFLLLYKKINVIFAIRQILPALIHNFILIFKVKEKGSYAKYYLKGIIHGICGVCGKEKGKA